MYSIIVLVSMETISNPQLVLGGDDGGLMSIETRPIAAESLRAVGRIASIFLARRQRPTQGILLGVEPASGAKIAEMHRIVDDVHMETTDWLSRDFMRRYYNFADLVVR